MSFIKGFRIGHRIYSLVLIMLVFLSIVGCIGIYKMNLIGKELKDISTKDMPMTLMLTEITENQLQQEIYFEKMLRYQAITARAEGESFDGAAKKFLEKGALVDEEILKAEKLAEEAIANAHNPEVKKEFERVLTELKVVEKAHKEYGQYAQEVISKIKSSANFEAGVLGRKPTEFESFVIKTEHKGEEISHSVETVLREISKFTDAAMQKALADEQRGIMLIVTVSSIVLLLGIVIGYFLARSIVKPVRGMTDAMNQLAQENLDVEIPQATFRDEIQDMSSAMVVFRDNMRRAKRLEAEQEKLKAKQQQRQNELSQLVGIFGSTIGAVFQNILNSSGQMVSKSSSMQEKSNSTQSMAISTSDEASQTSVSTQTLSAAAEEMSATITEISQRVNQTSTVVNDAVSSANNSKQDFQRLVQTSQNMAAMLQNISNVSGQINLLALNATIESARAGEAGKGFAVVASEVKNLASQTDKLTSEINIMIEDMQAACKTSSASIDLIATSINNVNEYISSIAAAIEEQSATTKEISGVAASVYKNSERVSTNVESIKLQSAEVEASSNEVNGFASVMKNEAEVLSNEVKTFLNAMQGTDIDDDTYEARNVSIQATATLGDKSSWNGRATEISCAHIVVSPAVNLAPAEGLEIQVDGLPALKARVAKHENGMTYLQLPLDTEQLAAMKKHVYKLNHHKKAA
jgi:methyl-accepting chemotaxis protein